MYTAQKVTSAIILLTFYDAAVLNEPRLVTTTVRTTTLLTPDELNALSKLKIPNAALCQELHNTRLESLHMPWWGHYCAELHDETMGQSFNAHAPSNNINPYYNPYHGQELKNLWSQFKRKQKLLSELQALEV